VSRTIRHDVVVLGAGPAGTAAAIRLAHLGIDVALVERVCFPRRHVGICIAEETATLLGFLGVAEPFRSSAPWRRALTAVHWGGAGPQFVEQRGYHVDRGKLDQLLLARASDEGVTIYQPARAMLPPAVIEGGYHCDLLVAGTAQRISCDFLIDAAGRRPALSGARTKDSPPLIAIHADWRLRSNPPFDGLIEAGTDAWAWYAQTAKDRATVSVFIDPRRDRSCGGNSLRAGYEHLLGQFPVLRSSLSGERCSEPGACNATSSHAVDVIGPHHIRIGDACMSVDPLSSQGVHLALQSGIQSAIIVNTILRRPAAAELAREFYRARICERVTLFSRRMRDEYARVAARSQHPFWQERAKGGVPGVYSMAKLRADPLPNDPGLRVRAATAAVISSGPIIVGDFVEQRGIVQHPELDQPVAFLAGVHLPTLLQDLPFAIGDLSKYWGDRVGEAKAREIARWLWQRRILVEVV
jgi:flavin-dependent dehydrogenase